MSIRRRLAVFVIAMISFLVIMGGLLQLGGPVIVGAFRQSLDSMNTLNAIREFKSNVNRTKTALNRYLLLGDSQELLIYEEASRLAVENLSSMEGRFRRRLPDWFSEMKQAFEGAGTVANQVVQEYKAGNKAGAFDRWASDLSPKFQLLSERVDSLEAEKSKDAQQMFLQIRNLSRTVGYVVTILFAVAILAGLFLFISLRRAVMGPLAILKEGAERFGKGHFEHRINVPASNEFGALAESFNQMAENVNQLQNQAVHMDRMSAVGQLAGGVAHEINNPLTAVLGQAQILLAKMREGDVGYGQLKKIENAAVRCRKIVRGLLDFSRPSQSEFEQIDVNNMIVSTLDLCEADLKKSRVNVSKKLFLKLPRIKGNMSELQQVLLNLINNAIQAMPHGGSMTIETRHHNNQLTFPGRHKGSGTRMVEGPWVEVSVKDTGVGIAPDHLERVFDPFFTTKDIGKGTGLGLSVSSGIVQKHGGGLRVETGGINHGATFIMTLPVSHL